MYPQRRIQTKVLTRVSGMNLSIYFFLVVMPLLFIMCVLVLRLKRRKKINIVDKSLEMKNMDEIEEETVLYELNTNK